MSGHRLARTAASRPADVASAPVVRVVDDDPSFLTAIVRRLRTGGYTVLAFSSTEAFLAGRTDAPGCVIADLRMPGAGGLELQEALLGSEDTLPVIFLTGQGDVRSSVLAMKRGAVDFLAKPVSGGELVEAVTRAIEADAAARAGRKRTRALRALFESLTPREREVLQLVVEGRSSREIAGLLGTTERTIKAHRANLMEKMRVDSVAALVTAAAWLDRDA